MMAEGSPGLQALDEMSRTFRGPEREKRNGTSVSSRNVEHRGVLPH